MIKEPEVNLELALQHGLTEEEYERIKDILRILCSGMVIEGYNSNRLVMALKLTNMVSYCF